MAKQKTFTLEEAHTLLPVLRSLLKRSMEGKRLIERVEKELQDLKHRILLSGGLMVDVPAVARRRAERGKALQGIKNALAGVDAIGGEGKKLEKRPADFPRAVGEENVFFCLE